ncbi:hypothetical protein [Bradyrhizobium algeriense]|uniref:hypothetical protein n=1 Tax=Bradyrhizobium algeriense TaxID=634784 RepID=UPI001FCE9597|nr:hypothetical protein [Bradyrhizobium algeriense]
MHGEKHCHAVTLCFYFHSFMRIQKTLAVTPAIAAGIADKVLHEVGCAALMNANQALALRGPYKKRVTEIEISKLRQYPIWVVTHQVARMSVSDMQGTR